MTEKFRLIEAEKAMKTPVKVSCEMLGVPRSGFYDWASRPLSDRTLADAWLTEQIKAIHEDEEEVYGSPRIHAELRMEFGIRVARKRVERLMMAAGISGLVEKKQGKTGETP